MPEPLVLTREWFPRILPEKAIGAELGVAKGAYSKVLLDSGRFFKLWCIDRWSDHHGLAEYLGCLERLPTARVLRASFAEAREAFPDGSFDFIYVDGYAHTGQDAGKTLFDWYPKVRRGGIFAGHDYHEADWPDTFKQVNRFVAHHRLGLNITKEVRWPSWWVRSGGAV